MSIEDYVVLRIISKTYQMSIEIRRLSCSPDDHTGNSPVRHLQPLARGSDAGSVRTRLSRLSLPGAFFFCGLPNFSFSSPQQLTSKFLFGLLDCPPTGSRLVSLSSRRHPGADDYCAEKTLAHVIAFVAVFWCKSCCCRVRTPWQIIGERGAQG